MNVEDILDFIPSNIELLFDDYYPGYDHLLRFKQIVNYGKILRKDSDGVMTLTSALFGTLVKYKFSLEHDEPHIKLVCPEAFLDGTPTCSADIEDHLTGSVRVTKNSNAYLLKTITFTILRGTEFKAIGLLKLDLELSIDVALQDFAEIFENISDNYSGEVLSNTFSRLVLKRLAHFVTNKQEYRDRRLTHHRKDFPKEIGTAVLLLAKTYADDYSRPLSQEELYRLASILACKPIETDDIEINDIVELFCR